MTALPRGCFAEQSVSEVLAVAANAFGVGEDELTGPSRCRPLCTYRQVGMTAAHRLGFSFMAIARGFGDRDHTTVMHAVERVTRDDRLSYQATAIADAARNQTGRLL